MYEKVNVWKDFAVSDYSAKAANFKAGTLKNQDNTYIKDHKSRGSVVLVLRYKSKSHHLRDVWS